MSILSGWLKTRAYRKTADGYKKESRDTSSETVFMNDGNTAETNLGDIKGITDSLTATSSNVALSAKGGNSLQGQINTLNSNLASKAPTSHSHFGETLCPSNIEIGYGANGHGGFIDFHFNGRDTDNTSRIIEEAEGVIDIIANLKNNGTNVSLDGHGHDDQYIHRDGRGRSYNVVSDINNFFNGIGLFNSAVENLPSSDWWLVISGGVNGTVTQVAYPLFNVTAPQTRFCAAGSWSNWMGVREKQTFECVESTTPDTPNQFIKTTCKLPDGFDWASTYILSMMIKRSDNGLYQNITTQVSLMLDYDNCLYVYVNDEFWCNSPFKIVVFKKN